MKKVFLSLTFVLFSILVLGQKSIEKMMDKYNVQSSTVLGHIFKVGDTLMFTTGSLPNGDFASVIFSPVVMGPVINLPVSYTNQKCIIVKVRHFADGLNTGTNLVFYVGKQPIWINVELAITKKEIFIKQQ